MSTWNGRPVIDLVEHPELEPDFGPTREELDGGAEPLDAISAQEKDMEAGQ